MEVILDPTADQDIENKFNYLADRNLEKRAR